MESNHRRADFQSAALPLSYNTIAYGGLVGEAGLEPAKTIKADAFTAHPDCRSEHSPESESIARALPTMLMLSESVRIGVRDGCA